MKLTIKSGSLIGLSVLLLVLLFGTGAPAHVKAAIQTARDHVYGALSTEHLVKVARQQLGAHREKLISAELSLQKQREKVELARRELAQLDGELAEARRRLELLRPALESGNGIGSFSHSDVEADAKALLDFAERGKRSREQLVERLAALSGAAESHEALLAQAREDYAKAEDRLESLAGELEAREAAADAEALANAIRTELSEGREGVKRTFDALEDRNNRLKLESARGPSGSGLPKGRVVLEGDRAEASRSLLERIDTFAPQRDGAADAAPQPSPLPVSGGASPAPSAPGAAAPVRIGSGSAALCRP